MASDFSTSLISFSVDLYKKLKSESDGASNLICSPFSIAAALSMTLAGAKHDTAKQISNALHMQDTTVHENFAYFFSKLPGYAPDVILHVANRLYAEETYNTLDEFTHLLEKSYSTTVEKVDFKRNAEKTRLQVNTWVEEVTQSKIKNLLAEGTVDEFTSLIIINAVYFKGLWHDQFDSKRTSQQEFHVTADRTKMVDMMHQKQRFRMCRHPNFKVSALEIPYKGQKTSMVILLPEEMDGLADLEETLTASKIREIIQELSYQGDIELSLPRFKLEHTVGLKKVLAAMGIEDMFDPLKCDLSGISPDNAVVVSDAVHKAFVEVNEEGTEAAAATAMVMLCCMSFPTRFTVDHPFLFLIRCHDPDVILFIGSVAQI
ncbi:unnamed protein product [Ixodes persulcatus]